MSAKAHTFFEVFFAEGLNFFGKEMCIRDRYYIDRLSCHIASSGRKYKSHAATIFKWAQEDAAKKAPKKGIPDYTCKEGESL